MIEDYDDKHVRVPDCSVVRETDAALLIESPNLPHGNEWIPKSQLHEDSEIYEYGTDGDLIITRWLADQKGIE